MELEINLEKILELIFSSTDERIVSIGTILGLEHKIQKSLGFSIFRTKAAITAIDQNKILVYKENFYVLKKKIENPSIHWENIFVGIPNEDPGGIYWRHSVALSDTDKQTLKEIIINCFHNNS